MRISQQYREETLHYEEVADVVESLAAGRAADACVTVGKIRRRACSGWSNGWRI